MIHPAGFETAAPARALRRADEPFRWLLTGLAAASLAACSDLNVSRNNAFDDRRPSARSTGVFKPGNVAGLEFTSADGAGTTGPDGGFRCLTEQPITFALGSIELGEAVCAGFVHPASLTPTGSLMDAAAVNMTRLLLLLDGDQQPDNGISIPQSLRTLAGTWPQVDFSTNDFGDQLVRIVADIASVEDRPEISIPSPTEAFEYLDSSLSCAYSGVFVNSFIAGPFTAPTEVALMIYREPGADTNVFEVRIRRNHPQSQMYLEARGTVGLASLPDLINNEDTGSGSISASFLTPNLISGTWSGAYAQQSIDRRGAFEALRIDDSPGQHRFIGRYEAPGEGSFPVVLGVVSMTLDGDTLTGELFDMTIGVSAPITGSRLPDSDLIEFTTPFSEQQATAMLVLDENGIPIGLEGDWPGTDEGRVSAVGCSLD